MRHIVYLGIAAGALVIGAGALVYRKLHSKCPTNAEMADILLAIDSGRTGRPEATLMASRFDLQGCADAARAVRGLLARKYPAGTTMASDVSTALLWPDSDPVCKSAIDQLPIDPRIGLAGLKLPSYRQMTRDVIVEALKSGNPKGLYHVADLLDSAEKTAAPGIGPIFARAATCLRDKADAISVAITTRVPAPTISSSFATLGHRRLPPRLAAMARNRQPVRGT